MVSGQWSEIVVGDQWLVNRKKDKESKGEGVFIEKRIVVIGYAAACAAAMPVLLLRGF